ncbi:MAG: TVP38/TMEM64 family protein [Bacillota bacterium]|jgi:uncharacterized membrane protein YdjX (TVP38/TMEM64 family)|uniref:TVP38/TMEM64 family protein n=1 Tax=Fictibacillus TaxID=1329200 RepID=UPI0018CFEE5B|nr:MULTISPECIES: VTT domain-containing protein [unclassified Fictibacillus]MBH0157187.1 TVP38/TMEM64 family protein [Fictibacillus sp. 5RED26]MBH0159508.1 TVP38/TMEM64 family protein [Fictibacillus sp. 26RED30]MBH0163692.1 TVP38/TMEM64 family protein [Fictibacillus sp. 7GRE50]MBH0169681.1 TVP38/TMEM64 family protein [Fictibacillus sp. 18YEL24]MBH0174181.1 TVP38/TMEM64 family protein [Fictibacillus sp. 23RED33]
MDIQGFILDLYSSNPILTVAISLSLNIIIAVLGIVPSVFLTGANIIFFGFWGGTFISFLGEILGALISFWLYKKGLNKFKLTKISMYSWVNTLRKAKGLDAFYLIFSLRLMPFIPSGIVTLAAAFTNSSFLVFSAATIVGKVPALLLEAFSVYQITQFTWIGKILLVLTAIYLGYLLFKNTNSK